MNNELRVHVIPDEKLKKAFAKHEELVVDIMFLTLEIARREGVSPKQILGMLAMTAPEEVEY